MIDETIHNELRQKFNPEGSELRNFQLHLSSLTLKSYDISKKQELMTNQLNQFLHHGN